MIKDKKCYIKVFVGSKNIIKNNYGIALVYILSGIVLLSILTAVIVHSNKGVLTSNDEQIGRYLANQALMIRTLILNCSLQYQNSSNDCRYGTSIPHPSFPCKNNENDNNRPMKINVREVICPGDNNLIFSSVSTNLINSSLVQSKGIDEWEFINDNKSVRIILKSNNYSWSSNNMVNIKNVIFNILSGSTTNNDTIMLSTIDEVNYPTYQGDDKYLCFIIKKSDNFPPCHNVFLD